MIEDINEIELRERIKNLLNTGKDFSGSAGVNYPNFSSWLHNNRSLSQNALRKLHDELTNRVRKISESQEDLMSGW